MSTKTKLKARRMWVNYYATGPVPPHATRRAALSAAGVDAVAKGVPVAVIPLDDVEALIDKASAAYKMENGYVRDSIRDALTAIGILPKQRKTKGRK